MQINEVFLTPYGDVINECEDNYLIGIYNEKEIGSVSVYFVLFDG